MEPENAGLQKESPFKLQVLCHFRSQINHSWLEDPSTCRFDLFSYDKKHNMFACVLSHF